MHKHMNTFLDMHIHKHTKQNKKEKKKKEHLNWRGKKWEPGTEMPVNPAPWTCKRGSGVQTRFPLQSEFGASLRYIRLCFPHPQNKSLGRWFSTYYATNSVHEEPSLIRLASCWWHRLVIPTSKTSKTKPQKLTVTDLKRRERRGSGSFRESFQITISQSASHSQTASWKLLALGLGMWVSGLAYAK